MEQTKLTLTSLSVCLLLLFSSCEKDADFVVPGGESKLFVISEITDGEKIQVSVSTSIGVNTEDDFMYPVQGEAKVILHENGIPLENPGFRYIPSQKAFVSQGAFRPEIGVEYGLEVKMNDEISLKPIYAETVIPEPTVLGEIQLLNLQNDGGQIDASLEIDVPLKSENRYYYLKTIGLTKSQEIRMNMNALVKSSGIYITEDGQGILIDRHSYEGNLPISLNGSSDFNEEFLGIEIEFITLTKDGYLFNKTYHKQISTQASSLSEPVISYTNVESGLGVFAGYSKYSRVFEL